MEWWSGKHGEVPEIGTSEGLKLKSEIDWGKTHAKKRD